MSCEGEKDFSNLQEAVIAGRNSGYLIGSQEGYNNGVTEGFILGIQDACVCYIQHMLQAGASLDNIKQNLSTIFELTEEEASDIITKLCLGII